MEYAEKMYLVPRYQLDKLKSENVRENIQQVVENDLDTSIRNILLRSDLDQYEKVKLYSNILTRYLAVVKQGDQESAALTLSLPQTTSTVADRKDDKDEAEMDAVADEVMKNVPSRSVKNSRYILEKMTKAKDLSAWNTSGEFVFKGRPIPGSHMLDLIKSITNPQKVRDDRRPMGWSEFLQAFAELNIPFSTVPSQHVRRAIHSLRGTPSRSTPPITHSKKAMKRLHASTPRIDDSEAMFKSPSIDRRAWMEF